MADPPFQSATKPPGDKLGFAADFRRFFVRGLAALLPTMITLWLLLWVWNFLWKNIGQYVIYLMQFSWYHMMPPESRSVVLIEKWLGYDQLRTQLLGVGLSIAIIYVIGVFIGNLLGRTAWRLAEVGVMKIPLVRAIYPAVKQVTDFLLSERTEQFQGSSVVAVEPHEKGIWSIGLVTGPGMKTIAHATGQDMITVFVPSSPTAFSGYVLVVPRASVIELPLKVEEAMRLLISGGVINPEPEKAEPEKADREKVELG
jgi:uncharacterized membrane protein